MYVYLFVTHIGRNYKIWTKISNGDSVQCTDIFLAGLIICDRDFTQKLLQD